MIMIMLSQIVGGFLGCLLSLTGVKLDNKKFEEIAKLCPGMSGDA